MFNSGAASKKNNVSNLGHILREHVEDKGTADFASTDPLVLDLQVESKSAPYIYEE